MTNTNNIHGIRIISTKWGYIHETQIISTERGDPQNADNIHIFNIYQYIHMSDKG